MNELFDWNDTIESDGRDYIVLEEGDYNFEITDFERGRFPGSDKIPPCNKAIITAAVRTEKGTATVKFDLILCRALEWKLAAFFRCIGQKKKDEPLKMDWTKVVGSKGRAHIKPRSYTSSSGEERQVNDIERFIDYDPTYFKTAGEPLDSSVSAKNHSLCSDSSETCCGRSVDPKSKDFDRPGWLKEAENAKEEKMTWEQGTF